MKPIKLPDNLHGFPFAAKKTKTFVRGEEGERREAKFDSYH